MPGRGITSSVGYRYGFNGKEDDQETVGTGNGTQDYGMRIYNPSLGKFLSVDPLASKFAFYSPYHFAGNTPIWAIDLDGEEPKESTSAEAISNPDPLTLHKYSSGQVIWKVDGYWVNVHNNYSDPNQNRYFYYEPSKDKGKRWIEFFPKTEDQLGREQVEGTMAAVDGLTKVFIGASIAPLTLPILPEIGFVSVGEAGLATYLGTSALRTVIDVSAQTAVNGGDLSKLDVADALMNGFLTPRASAVFGGAIDYKPFSNGDKFSLIGYNKDVSLSLFEMGAKYTFGRDGIVGSQIGKIGSSFSTLATGAGSSILQPIVTAPFTFGGKLIQSEMKKAVFGSGK